MCKASIAAKEGTSISYSEATLEARSKQARKCSIICRRSRIAYDKQANYGPPDRQCHFNDSTCRELEPSAKCQKVAHIPVRSDSGMECTESSPQEDRKNVIGRRLQMRFYVEASRTHEWFDGKIVGFNHISGTHNVYFESDGQTIAVNISEEEDDNIVFYK